MKKNKPVKIIICLICTVLMAGCGKSTDSSELSDNMKDKAVAVSQEEKKEEKPEKIEEKPENSEKTEEKTEEQAPRGVPDILLFRQNEYKYLEPSAPAIKHQYTYLMLDGDSAKTYEGLAASLENARDEILSMQKKAWNDDLEKIEENGLLTFKEGWKTYIRRADDEYLSFVTEYSGEGMFDNGAYTEYTAHSYYVEGGKEIAFSDVIADEDAFFGLLSDKMYESINNKLQQYYSFGIDEDKTAFKTDMMDYMKSGKLAWTLDPFGVTCYLPAYTKAPFAESAVVQFSEDADHVIFADDFRDGEEAEYIIQIPEYVGSYIDVNDSGVPSFVDVSEYYDYSEEQDDMYLFGLHVSCAGDGKNIPITMSGGTDFYNIFLIHKDGSTVVLENHDEYDTSFLNTYVLDRHEVREADSARGCLEWAGQKDYDINGEGYTPVYVPTDPSKIRVLTGDGDYAEDWSPTVISTDSKGNIEVFSDIPDA